MVDFDIAEDGDTQPPESHDNEAHDREFVDEGEAADAAPVQSVNGQQGDVEVDGGVSDHSELSGVTSGQHHSRYTDAEAVDAVNPVFSFKWLVSSDLDEGETGSIEREANLPGGTYSFEIIDVASETTNQEVEIRPQLSSIGTTTVATGEGVTTTTTDTISSIILTVERATGFATTVQLLVRRE